MHPRVSRRLIPVPGVIGPVATGECLFRSHSADLGVEQRERVVQPVHPIFADDTEKTHPSAHLDAASASAPGGLNHFGLVALGQQPFLSLLAAIAGRDGDEGLGDVVRGILPGDLDKLILSPPIKHVLCLVFRGQFGKPCVGPSLPSLADNWMPQAIGSIDDPMKGVPLGALAWVPVRRGFVPVEIGVPLVVIG